MLDANDPPTPGAGHRLDVNVPYVAGDRIAQRYVVEELLGRGGMGVVLRAFDERLHRAVALKVLPSSAHLDGIARARMVREARSAAALNHPGIVQIYDVGDTGDGGTFLAMELVRGRSLREAARQGWLSPATLARLAPELGATLAAAHREGLVHRDVKPDNVMVRTDGRIVVLDFGLAKPTPVAAAPGRPEPMALTDDGSIVGTPAYLSPEQARGEPLTGASDQFALAVTLFELLTGQLPWLGTTPTSVLASMLVDDPKRASELVSTIPTSVDDVLARGLAKRSADRYADCEALGRAFAEALGESTVGLELRETAAAPTPASSPSRPSRDPLGSSSRPASHATQHGQTVPVSGGTYSAARTDPDRGSDDAQTRSDESRDLAHAPDLTARTTRPTTGRTALVTAMVLGGVALAGAVWQAWTTRTASDVPAQSAGPLVLGRDTVLACPLLGDERGGSDKGWLAAAIATAVCERARWMLGGRPESTRIPAELLGLSSSPDERADTDVFVAANARQSTLDEAARGATAWLDGSFSRHGRALEVHAILRRREGAPLGEVEAHGTVREIAVAITDAWARAGVLPSAQPIDDELARWTLVSDGTLALARFDAEQAYWLMEEAPAACATLLAHEAQLDPLVRATIPGWTGLGTAPAEDVSTPARMAMTALSSPSPRVDLVESLAEARTRESSPIGRAVLAVAEATGRSALDRDRTIEVLLVASTTFPRAGRDMWPLLAFTALDTAVGPAVNESYSEWCPWDPDAWATGALALRAPDPRRLVLLRRAHAVAPRNTSVAADLAFAQIDAGSVASARSVAAEIADAGPDQRFVSELISVVAASAEGRIGAAMERARALISSLDVLFSYRKQDFYLASWVAELTLLTEDRTLADLYLERALAERRDGPYRGGSPTAHDTYLALLALVGTPELGRQVMARLEGRDPIVQGVRAWLEGDAETATRLLRQLLNTPETLGAAVTVAALADLLAAHGGEALVERADEALGEARGPFHGIGMLDVRRARRHAARGETDRARAEAQRVVDALADGDLDLPVVEEMRRLAAH